MSRQAKILIGVTVGFVVIVAGLLLVQFVLGLKYKTVVDTKTDNIDSFGGAVDGYIYYVQNSRLLKKSLSSQKTEQLTSRVSAQTQLSPDQKKLFYAYSSGNSSSSANLSGALKTLGSSEEIQIPSAGRAFWFSSPLYYEYDNTMSAGSVINDKGELVLPTYPYSYISNFGNDRLVYTYGEGSTYDLTLKVYSLSQNREISKLFMNKYASGPVFFGDYMGYLDTSSKLVVFGQDLQPKTLNLPVGIDALTQQAQETQYYVDIKNSNGTQVGEIYELNLATSKAQMISSANFTPLFKNNKFVIESLYYDKSTDSLFIRSKEKLYTISKIHKP